MFGWAYSDVAVTNPSSSSSALSYHSAGFGDFGATLANAKSASFSTWAATAVASNTTTSGSGSNSTSSSGSSSNTTATIANATYDYIVAGAGAAGLIVAERLVESGASVLLIERGGASLYSTGNNNTLSWNSSVTMYDVPGFDYYLANMDAAYCTDTASQAGCLLGGGTMVNAMMYVKPQEKDFDDKWPTGWKWTDVSASADRLYERNPGQTYGSEDGIRYNDFAYDVLSNFFAGPGYKSVDAIKQPNEKINVFSHPPWSEQDGLRAGPARNYLPLAQGKSNFELMLNTKVIRAVRNSTTISGVEVEDSTGARIIYKVKTGGSVILSAGAMSTPRILFNSGIGPTKQIQTVQNGTTGVTLPAQSEWIELPVGCQIKDHVIFTLKFNTTTDLPALTTDQITSPNETAIDLFAKGSGVLAESGQRFNWWTSVTTSDGTEIYLQGTCNGPSTDMVQMKVYLTHGLTSVGELGITAGGATEFITQPWLTTDTDVEAATMAMDNLLKMTRQANSTLFFYSSGADGSIMGANLTGADLIKTYVTGAHFVGTVKMGNKNDSTASVDTNTKVFGTDNLFVVDASMHPDLPTGNTQAIVMVAAEAAAEKILALKGKKISDSGSSSGSTSSSGSYGYGSESASAAATEVVSSSYVASSTADAEATSSPADYGYGAATSGVAQGTGYGYGAPSSAPYPISSGVAAQGTAAPSGAAQGSEYGYGSHSSLAQGTGFGSGTPSSSSKEGSKPKPTPAQPNNNRPHHSQGGNGQATGSSTADAQATSVVASNAANYGYGYGSSAAASSTADAQAASSAADYGYGYGSSAAASSIAASSSTAALAASSTISLNQVSAETSTVVATQTETVSNVVYVTVVASGSEAAQVTSVAAAATTTVSVGTITQTVSNVVYVTVTESSNSQATGGSEAGGNGEVTKTITEGVTVTVTDGSAAATACGAEYKM